MRRSSQRGNKAHVGGYRSTSHETDERPIDPISIWVRFALTFQEQRGFEVPRDRRQWRPRGVETQKIAFAGTLILIRGPTRSAGEDVEVGP
jgi:hypothetical protein